MNHLLTAIAVMAGATLAQHLGLTDAIARVIRKIASCPMCCTFWTSIGVLTAIYGATPAEAALLSILAAYMSHWFVIVLVLLQKIYDKLWRRTTKR